MDTALGPVYVFDLDGVVTNAHTSEINDEVIRRMYQLLAGGSYVAVNTGRSYEWVDQIVISRLIAYGGISIFERFIVICEKGGEIVQWQDAVISVRPSEFALDHEVYALAKQTFEQNQASLQSMFWDTTKRTMATLEKVPSASLDDFHAEQRILIGALTEALAGYDAKIDQTNISIDIESPEAGKYAGARIIYAWILGLEPLSPKSFISIGDSISDYEMARYFAEQSALSTFVYVGKHVDKIVHHGDVTFIATAAHYDMGTLEFLASI